MRPCRSPGHKRESSSESSFLFSSALKVQVRLLHDPFSIVCSLLAVPGLAARSFRWLQPGEGSALVVGHGLLAAGAPPRRAWALGHADFRGCGAGAQ